MKSYTEIFEKKTTLTPLLDQYFDLKQQCPDSLLLFRVGDFYEAYGEDGKILSNALEIVLTGRDVRGSRIPMAGVPHHTLENHLRTLLAKGHKVAVSEQLEEAAQAKGLIERDIVRFLTPGTILEGSLLHEKEPNFLLAVFPLNDKIGLSWADISTGAWHTAIIPREREHEIDQLQHEFSRISPKEILLPSSFESSDEWKAWLQRQAGLKVSYCSMPPGDSMSVAPFPGAAIPFEAQQACRLLFHYLEKVYRGNVPGLSDPVMEETGNYLVLDSITCRNLELFRNLASGEKEGSLLHLLDKTGTPMGGRLLRRWLLYPLLDLREIERRQDAIADLLEQPSIFEKIRNHLAHTGDLERLTSRVSYQTANARELLSISVMLNELPRLVEIFSPLKAEIFSEMKKEIPDFSSLCEILNKGLQPDPPLSLKEGGLIREGFDAALDSLKSEAKEAMEWIANLEEKEKRQTGIKSLKVGYNQLFGYHIEITRTNLPNVPKHYIRKQTLLNAERFVTEELKLQEARILRAQEKVKNLEYEIFCRLRCEAKKHDKELKKCAAILAQLDALTCLAHVALERNFGRPVVDSGDAIAIKGGRHPVVEAASPEPFVPNDVFLDAIENRLLVVTGPNMAGKSTYLRQVALIVILAQIGCFVPADAANIGVVDRIFTRIGASDNLHRGESTFYVEMRETAEILKKSMRKSLVLLDEIGRGTSTFDGLSLAWATAEELLRTGGKVLFATHYHEMTLLASNNCGAKNFTVAIKEEGEEVVFLRQIVSGCSDKSYGIHVARLAGVPEQVVLRAKEILTSLEKNKAPLKSVENERQNVQLRFFSPHPISKALKEMDINALSGLEALNLLAQWKKQYAQE